MRRVLGLVATLACIAASAASPLETWGRLASVTGTFTQVKTLRDVDVRLTSHGHFSFQRGRRFAWHVTAPVPSSFVATPARYESRAGGRVETRELSSLGMSAALRALIGGDLSKLDAAFQVAPAAQGVTLVPRTKELAALVSEVRLAGGACLERAHLVYANGDALDVRLCGVPLPDEAASAGTSATAVEGRIKAAWKPGDRNDWPSASLKPVVADWSAFDRLAIDVTNLGDGGETVSLYLMSPETPRNDGKYCHLRAPAWETVRWEVPLKYFADGKADQKNVSRISFHTHRPPNVDLTFSGLTLLKPGEAAPEARTPARLAAALAKGRADYDRRRAAAQARFLADLTAANARDGAANDRIAFGVGTGMDQVRPKGPHAPLKSAREVRVRLARNEWEGKQIFVTPVKDDLKNASVTVSPLVRRETGLKGLFGGGETFPRDAVKVSVIGYVKTTEAPRYGVGYCVPTNVAPGYARVVKKADLGWWPDLLLDYLPSADVAAGDVQGFWVSVHAPENQRAGTYAGTLTIAADGARPVKLPFAVRVNDFTLPKTPVIPTLVSFSPGAHVGRDRKQEHTDFANACKAAPESPFNLWKKHEREWGDFLADHFITLAPLYHHGHALPWDVWARLEEQGRLGWFNLAYFSSQPVPKTPEQEKRWTQWADWVSGVIAKNYAEAKKRGLEKHALVYCCDEAATNRFPEIDRVLAKLKADHPAIPFLTTSYDDSFGTEKFLNRMDGFCPQPHKYDLARAEKARAAGHKVWWYFACDQRAPCANVYTEGLPSEIRIFAGAAAARERPDGFLYYQCAYFNNAKCVTGGPFTDWNPRSWWRQHGDATWVGAGPEGRPLSTIRLENFRDGFEDLAYARLLEAKTGRHVEVPREIWDSPTNFTDDPQRVERWREEMADQLEQHAAR